MRTKAVEFLQTKVDDLRLDILKLQAIIAQLQVQADLLRVPPQIPAEISPQELSEIFERADRDNEISVLETAIAQLHRRQATLTHQLDVAQLKLVAWEETRHRQRLRAELQHTLTKGLISKVKTKSQTD